MHLLNICIWTSALLVLAGAALYVQGRPSGFDQVQNILGDTDHHLDEEYYDDEEPTSTEVQCSNPPCSRNESFMWLKGHWTQCNAVCDGGQRHRPVICYESTFARHVSDLHCKTKKPRNRMECAMDPCPGEWRNGPWSACTASCGVGIQYRHVACHLRHHQQLVVKRDVRIANITLCNPATRPLKVRFCNITESNCPPRIPYPSDNRELSIMADLGVDPDAPAPTTTEQHERQQSRIRRSIPAWRRDRRASFEQPRFEGPVVDEVIHHSTAQRASWKMIEVKRCSRKCGTGNRTIQAYCADTAHGDKPFEEVKCAKKPRPPARIVPCNTDPCIVEYRWLEAEWKPCSERCGNGTRSRRQICVRVTLTGTGEVVNVTMKRGQNRSLCGGQRSKEITEECRLKDCVGWHQGPWSQCTSPCKLRPGIQNTTTRCLNLRTGLPATDCDIANRPDDVRQCFSNRSCSKHHLRHLV